VREDLGRRARAYAESTFHVDAVADRFVEVLEEVRGRRRD
jgi:hypothetical protein